MATAELPTIPVPRDQLIRYISERPDANIFQLLEPYRAYESALRGLFAQQRTSCVLEDPYINVLPLFTDDTKLCTTRARRLDTEDEDEKARYIMPLDDRARRPHGAPATVPSIEEFQHNFSVFSEQSLVDLEWGNVVVAGSAVLNCLLPVPQEFKVSKRKTREYFHEVFCPASDVDIFLYGLTHDEAIEKIKTIERNIRDALLTEVTVIRTKHAITFVSKYPTRHIQIVLRIYKSVSEILTGFDIDASGVAYDGTQVYVTPRALGSLMTQINHVDLSRRSPSYENRLAKYANKHFEVYWEHLDRSRIDPTIFERSFRRTLGLARLLVLERLPTKLARDQYNKQRRQERGRPELPQSHKFEHTSDIKKCYEEEVSDTLESSASSNYNTFTIPYGNKYSAKKIEKLCYTTDILLNAEWNQPKDATMYLHRHPAFFGRVEDVIQDCCGCCPVPETPEEIEQAKKWAELYIQGPVSFMVDDPGRQEIGSFNPVYDDEWTTMAYVSRLDKICQSIVSCDLQAVTAAVPEIAAEPHSRDHTGRTLLHLAVMCSSPAIVKVLVDAGVRITSRVVDGRTALHLAAERGDVAIVRILMDKSLENEELDQDRTAKKHKALLAERKAAAAGGVAERSLRSALQSMGDGESDIEMVDGEQSDAVSVVTGSFVMVDDPDNKATDGEAAAEDDEGEGPDYYTSDLVAWDIPNSPMHAAIVAGHEEVVKALSEYGIDIMRPFIATGRDNKQTFVMTLYLATKLPLAQAQSMVRLLLSLGASSAHADSSGHTVLQSFVEDAPFALVQTLLEHDRLGVRAALNHVFVRNVHMAGCGAMNALSAAVSINANSTARRLLALGADCNIAFGAWMKGVQLAGLSLGTFATNHEPAFYRTTQQPLIAALELNVDPRMALELVRAGADVNALTPATHQHLASSWASAPPASVLDLVRTLLAELRKYNVETEYKQPTEPLPMPQSLYDAEAAAAGGSYRRWCLRHSIQGEEAIFKSRQETYNDQLKNYNLLRECDDIKIKAAYISSCLATLEELEALVVQKGGKTFAQMYPDRDDISAGRHYINRPYHPRHEAYKTPEHPVVRFQVFGADVSAPGTQQAYEAVFEAAWAGDSATILKYTAAPWGEGAQRPPLILAVQDSQGNSPFSLAFLRGHLDTAKAILAVIQAQYVPRITEKKHTVKVLARDGDGSDSDSEDLDACGGGSGEVLGMPALVTVDHGSFEIKDIRATPDTSCAVSAFNVLTDSVTVFDARSGDQRAGKSSIMQWLARSGRDAELIAMVELCLQYAPLSRDRAGETLRFEVPDGVFQDAVANGMVAALECMIARTGAGMPLDALVKHALPKREEKPKYYQGLTVYGRKRKDWAAHGLPGRHYEHAVLPSPLIMAAKASSLAAVEWALGLGPKNLYLEYGQSATALARPAFKSLAETPGLFESSLDKWLSHESEYVLHCAIMAPNYTDETLKVVDFLLKDADKKTLERTTAGQNTPLLLAAKHGRPEIVTRLLKAGANARARNASGHNLIHAMLHMLPPADHLKLMLDMLDGADRAEMLLERSWLADGGMTPAHMALKKLSALGSLTPARVRQFADVLLSYLAGAELDVSNALGDTVLHDLVSARAAALVDRLGSFRPSLLQRENAAGKTPLELATDQLRAVQFAVPGLHSFITLAYMHNRQRNTEGGMEQHPARPVAWFTAEAERQRAGSRALAVWTAEAVMVETCGRHAGRAGAQRQLATLGQVRDVAERMAQAFKHVRQTHYFRDRHDEDVRGAAEEEGEAETKSVEWQSVATQREPGAGADSWKLVRHHGTDIEMPRLLPEIAEVAEEETKSMKWRILSEKPEYACYLAEE